MERPYSRRSSRDSSRHSPSPFGAELSTSMNGQPPNLVRRGVSAHDFEHAPPRLAGLASLGAPNKRSSDEAGFLPMGATVDDRSAELRSFKRLRIDGAGTSLGTTRTSTTASSSTCGSVSPPLLTPAPLQPLPSRPSEVSFRPQTSDQLGTAGPAAASSELSRSVSSDSAAFQTHQPQHYVQHGPEPSAQGNVRNYAGINHVLGDLHALRRQRLEASQRGQDRMQPSEGGIQSVQAQGGLAETGVGTGSFAASEAPFGTRDVFGTRGARVLPPPAPPRHQQQQQQQGSNPHQQLPPPPPRWRRSVRLPTSSRLY